MFRVFIADDDPENIRALIRLFKKEYGISAEIWKETGGSSGSFRYPEAGVIFIRIDNPSVEGLKLTVQAREFSPAIQLVWMATSGLYAFDAFSFEVDAYLLLPATERTMDEIINSLSFI